MFGQGVFSCTLSLQAKVLIRLYADITMQARKLAKKRLGTLKRAKGKVEELTNVIAEQRR